MKNKALIITLIILLSIIIFLLVIFLVTYLKDGMNFRNKFEIFGSKNSNVILDKQFEIEDIKSIDIRQVAGDIIFKETSDNCIQVIIYGEDESDVKIDLSNSKLNIDYTHKNRFALFNFGVTKNDIIIYIPANYSNEIKIKNNYGRCEIIDLENATVDIDCDAGDVELGKVKNVNVKCDYGNINIKDILNKCDVKADCGNIKIDTISIQEDSTIKADLGNIDIENTNDIYIDVDSNLGEVNINRNNRNAEVILKIKCDCGNIIIDN